MDVKITNGDIDLRADGAYRVISGLAEAIQRVRMVILTNRGSFIYDRRLGTDYGAFSPSEALPAEKLDMLIKEAAADIGGVETEVVSYDSQTSVVAVRVTYHGASAVTEVDISGNL